jgi:hypothetical protein
LTNTVYHRSTYDGLSSTGSVGQIIDVPKALYTHRRCAPQYCHHHEQYIATWRNVICHCWCMFYHNVRFIDILDCIVRWKKFIHNLCLSLTKSHISGCLLQSVSCQVRTLLKNTKPIRHITIIMTIYVYIYIYIYIYIFIYLCICACIIVDRYCTFFNLSIYIK